MSKTKGWIIWRKSDARAMILEDLEPGGVLIGMDHLSAEDVWEYYRKEPQFKLVVFSQFEARLKDHRKQAGDARKMAKRDALAVVHDRSLYQRHPHNKRGELVFDMHPAKHLLRTDVKDKVHETMGPSALQKTRPEYMLFKQEIFQHRIYQEIRHQKFLHYLALKRAKQRRAPPRNRTQFLASAFAAHYASQQASRQRQQRQQHYASQQEASQQRQQG
jgi:hypothetical protein